MASKRQLSLIEIFGKGREAMHKRHRIDCIDLDASDNSEQLLAVSEVTDQGQSGSEQFIAASETTDLATDQGQSGSEQFLAVSEATDQCQSTRFETVVASATSVKEVIPSSSNIVDQTHSMDIGLFSSRFSYGRDEPVTREEKYQYLTGVWKPSKNFKFPKKNEFGKSRSFNYHWLETFAWLSYSPALDGAFCLPCVLFACDAVKSGQKLERLLHKPLDTWTSAMRKFKEHESNSKIHKAATVMASEFKKNMEGKTTSIHHQLDQGLTRIIQQNREKLSSILKTIIFCGKQNIPLRGHRDDSHCLTINDNNSGNFQKLLEFRIDSGDKVLETHLSMASKNATYRSKTIQNELISCCGDFITNKIVQNIKEAGFFSIMADEATDSSNVEQLILVIRYCQEKSFQIQEDFIGFLTCTNGITGESIAAAIIDKVNNLGLDMSLCRGQSYDGAGNMAGSVKGAAARIKALYPLATYVHCSSHQLNLSVMKACSNQAIRNMMGTVTELANYFNFSPKRQSYLDSKIVEFCPQSKVSKLKDLCRTRWVYRLDALDTAFDLLEAVVETLNGIRNDNTFNSESVTKANGLFHAVTQCEFITALVVCKETLAYTRGITVKLQGKSVELMEAYHSVEMVIENVKKMRLKIEEYNKSWFKNIQEIADKLAIEIKKPRSCGRQMNRNNVSADSPEEYYKRSLTIPFLDHMVQELTSRFSNSQQQCIPMGQVIVPEKMKQTSKWRVNFRKFIDTYSCDLLSEHSVNAELDMWEMFWKSNDRPDPPTTSQETLKVMDKQMFPNIAVMLKIMCTIPVTTCECERSVSALRRLKTYMRSSMVEDRLNGLALMHVHYGISIDIEEVLDLFARKHPRRLQLVSCSSTSSDT